MLGKRMPVESLSAEHTRPYTNTSTNCECVHRNRTGGSCGTCVMLRVSQAISMHCHTRSAPRRTESSCTPQSWEHQSQTSLSKEMTLVFYEGLIQMGKKNPLCNKRGKKPLCLNTHTKKYNSELVRGETSMI